MLFPNFVVSVAACTKVRNEPRKRMEIARIPGTVDGVILFVVSCR